MAHYKAPPNGKEPLFVALNCLPQDPPIIEGERLFLIEGWAELAEFYRMWGLPWTIEHLQILFPRPSHSEVIRASLFWQHIYRLR